MWMTRYAIRGISPVRTRFLKTIPLHLYPRIPRYLLIPDDAYEGFPAYHGASLSDEMMSTTNQQYLSRVHA